MLVTEPVEQSRHRPALLRWQGRQTSVTRPSESVTGSRTALHPFRLQWIRLIEHTPRTALEPTWRGSCGEPLLFDVREQEAADVFAIGWRDRLRKFVLRHPGNAHRKTPVRDIGEVSDDLNHITVLHWAPHLDLWSVVRRVKHRRQRHRRLEQAVAVDVESEHRAAQGERI